MTVLIIEDDREVADLVTKLVDSIGTVTWRMNWAAGMEVLGNCQFDVILLDLGLPDSSTSQTLASIKESCEFGGLLHATTVAVHGSGGTPGHYHQASLDGLIRHRVQRLCHSCLTQLEGRLI